VVAILALVMSAVSLSTTFYAEHRANKAEQRADDLAFQDKRAKLREILVKIADQQTAAPPAAPTPDMLSTQIVQLSFLVQQAVELIDDLGGRGTGAEYMAVADGLIALGDNRAAAYYEQGLRVEPNQTLIRLNLLRGLAIARFTSNRPAEGRAAFNSATTETSGSSALDQRTKEYQNAFTQLTSARLELAYPRDCTLGGSHLRAAAAGFAALEEDGLPPARVYRPEVTRLEGVFTRWCPRR
jgi:hypothetical protein